MRVKHPLRCLILFLLSSVYALSQGGPPLQTDDPGTPGNENWEINVGYTIARNPQIHQYEAPIVDINYDYGLGSRIQLKYQTSWAINSTPMTGPRAGWGNSLVGVKWRFFDDEKHGIFVSTYPQLEFNNPTHSVERGLAPGGTSFLLPAERAKKVGVIDLDGEVGHWFSPEHPGWITGLAVGKQATERLELLGELYRVTAPKTVDRQTSFDFGSRVKLQKSVLLIFMAGRSFHGPATGQPQFIGYFGLQFLILDKWEPEDHPGETKRP
jgi:hypothetical protein